MFVGKHVEFHHSHYTTRESDLAGWDRKASKAETAKILKTENGNKDFADFADSEKFLICEIYAIFVSLKASRLRGLCLSI
jgi:hypothetical protein